MKPDSDLARRVAELDAQGLATPLIAVRCGITQHRVEWILDQLAGADRVPITGTPNVTPAPKPVKIPAPRKGGRPPARCGTPGGYQRHRRLGETACDACRIANRDVQRARKAATRATTERPAPASVHEQESFLEWAVRGPGGVIERVSAETASKLGALGDEVLTRTVSVWRTVPGTGQAAAS